MGCSQRSTDSLPGTTGTYGTSKEREVAWRGGAKEMAKKAGEDRQERRRVKRKAGGESGNTVCSLSLNFP